MIKQQKLIPSLNGLRAMSILIVIISHWDKSAGMPESLSRFLTTVFYGIIGVRMFFVISGFVITVLLLRELESTGTINFRAFYYRRMLRIFPPFYAFIVVLGILKWAGLIYIDGMEILIAFLYAENFKLPFLHWFVGHTWSLAIEEQFYLIWPLLLYKLRSVQFRMIHIILVVAGCVLMRAFFYKYTIPSRYFLAPFFMHADCLFTGCYIGYLYFAKRDDLQAVAGKINSLWLLTGVVLTWFAATMEYHPKYDIVFIPLSAIIISGVSALFLIRFVLRPQSSGGRFLNTRLMDFIGRLSYSLYLWQQLFLGVHLDLLDPRLHWMARYPCNLGLAILAALISYYCIEKPFLRLKHQFSARQ